METENVQAFSYYSEQRRKQYEMKNPLDQSVFQRYTPYIEEEDIPIYQKPDQLPASLSKEEATEDIHYLFQVLKAAYGFYFYFGGDEAFYRIKQELLEVITAQTGSIIHKEFKEHIINKLTPIIIDGHFSVDQTPLIISTDHNTKMQEKGKKAFEYEIQGNTIILIVRRMYIEEKEDEENLQDFIQSGKICRDFSHIIIDLRGNHGGSDVYPYEWFRAYTGREPDYRYAFGQRYCNLVHQKFSDMMPDYVPEKEYGWDCSFSDGTWCENQTHITVLIDHEVASAAESMVAYLRTMDNVIFQGTHTAGAFQCGNCITVTLPNSGIDLYFGTGILFVEDDANHEGTGFGPDMLF